MDMQRMMTEEQEEQRHRIEQGLCFSKFCNDAYTTSELCNNFYKFSNVLSQYDQDNKYDRSEKDAQESGSSPKVKRMKDQKKKKKKKRQRQDYQCAPMDPLTDRNAPRKEDGHLRVVTFNVHFWSDVDGKRTFKECLELLNSFDADVIALQEISDTKFPLVTLLMPRYTQQHHHWASDYGIMVLVRKKIGFMQRVQPLWLTGYQDDRSALIAAVEKHRHVYRFGVSHLDVFDETGLTRVKQLTEINDALGAQKDGETHIILGDLNSLHKKQLHKTQLNAIVKQNEARGLPVAFSELPFLESVGYVDSFELGKQHPPAVSCWTGRRVDFVMVRTADNNSKEKKMEVYSRAVPTTLSDHYPIVVDLWQ